MELAADYYVFKNVWLAWVNRKEVLVVTVRRSIWSSKIGVAAGILMTIMVSSGLPASSVDTHHVTGESSERTMGEESQAGYVIVDDFESYKNTDDLKYRWVPSGNAEVSLVTDPAHEGAQSMRIAYDNEQPPYYSKVRLTFDEPQDWTAEDIKSLSLWLAVYPESYGSFNCHDGTCTVTGAGADIWDTSDQFYYAHKKLTFLETPQVPTLIVARLTYIEPTDPWAKAGVMIRKSLDADSEHAMVVVTPDNGVAMQYRAVKAGTTYTIPGSGSKAPRFVKLVRSGNIFTGSESLDAVLWAEIGSVDITMSTELYVGLAVTSHAGTRQCEGNFSNVAIETPAFISPWTAQDIGFETSESATVWVGWDDTYLYEYEEVADDLTNPDDRTWENPLDLKIDFDEVGVALTTCAAEVNLAEIIGMSIITGDPCGIEPGGSGTICVDDIRLHPPRCIPSLISPHADTSGDCAVSYEDLPVIADDWLIHDVCEPVWDGPLSSKDIGGARAGRFGYNATSGIYTIDACGEDIWDRADAFRYAYRPMSGDGQMTVRVTSIENTDGWAKAGIMIRETLAANSKHAMIVVTPEYGVAFQHRPITDGFTASTEHPGLNVPICLRLVRTGDTFVGYCCCCQDVEPCYAGQACSWQPVGTATIPMNTDVYIGLAVTSHKKGVRCTAKFDRLCEFSAAELHRDGVIDFRDYAELADDWLHEKLWPPPY